MNVFSIDSINYYYVLFFIFIIGLCIGSFSNVVILRAFSGESIVLPPSKCPKCHNKLKWYHNIPLLSYIFLRGKCGFCKEKISIQYPIVELLTGLIFAAVFLKFGMTINSVFLCICSVLAIIMSVTDIKEQVIFTIHAYILAVIGLIYNFFNFSFSTLGTIDFNIFSVIVTLNKCFINSILGLIVGFLILPVIVFIFKLFTGKEGFGSGDYDILAALGAVFGVQALPYILIFSAIVNVVFILPNFLKKFYTDKNYKFLSSLILFVLFTSLNFMFGEKLIMKNLFLWVLAILPVLVFGGYLCVSLLKQVRNATIESVHTLPFGPALYIGAGIYLFCFM